jgi:hypothetical protein
MSRPKEINVAGLLGYKLKMKVVQQAHNIISKVEASMTSTITEDNKVLLEKLLLECFNNLHANRVAPDIEDQ